MHTHLYVVYVHFAGNTNYSPGPYTYSITFSAGMTTASFDIIIIDDSFTEENEQFYLTIDPLTLSSDVMFDNLNAAVITIVDDDGELCINYY